MQFKEPFNDVLGSRSKIKILRFLCNQTEDITGREIARRIDLSHLKTHQVLKEFHKHNIVNMRQIGSAMLYRLNEDNMLVRDILKNLFKSENEPIVKLTEVVIKRLRVFVESITLFGKIMYDGRNPDTEIEILLVVRDDMNLRAVETGVKDTADEVMNIFGNKIVAVIWNMEELCSRYRQEDDLFIHIKEIGKTIHGKDIQQLIQNSLELDFRR